MDVELKSLMIFWIALFLILVPVNAHTEEIGRDSPAYLNYVLIASVISGSLVLFSILYKKRSEKLKMMLFLGIAIPIIIATIYVAASTVYLNITSETGGPVHWHADFEIWNCGKPVYLIDPEDLANRVGTPVLHEHGDNRMHVEGVLARKADVNLHGYFEAVGGRLTKEMMVIPTNEGEITIKNNDKCNGKQGELQVFLYKVINPGEIKKWVFSQEKLEDFEEYVLSPHPNVPPGDCIIIEFGEEKNKTNHICESYRIATERGELTGS